MKILGKVIVLALVGGIGLMLAAYASGGETTHPPTTTTGGGHDPVTICHKPGTPAQHEITTDDSSIIDAHLMHGDTLGPCPPDETTTTEPPECPNGDLNGELPGCEPETTTTVPPERCPPGMVPEKGKDGNPGDQECCFPGVDCDGDTPPPTEPPVTTTPPPTTGETTTTVEPTTEEETTEPEEVEEEPTPDKAPPVKAKPPKKHTATCQAPAYMLDGECVRDFKGTPHPISRGSG